MANKLALVALVAVLVSACSSADGFPVEAASLPPTQAPYVPPEPERLSDEEIRELLQLRGDGVGSFRFGDPVETVVPSLTQTFGQPDEDIGLDCQSAIDRHVRWAELGLGFAGVALVSWTVGSEYPPSRIPPLDLATTDGVRLGSARTHLERLDGMRTTHDGTDGAEHLIGAPGGDIRVFTAGRPPVVVAMTAGTPC